jgi:hypothetical protein
MFTEFFTRKHSQTVADGRRKHSQNVADREWMRQYL